MVYFPVAVIQFRDNSMLWEEGFVSAHSSRIQSFTAEKSRKEELEAAGHTPAAARKAQLT